MRTILSLSILASTLLFLSGCGNSEDAPQKKPPVTIDPDSSSVQLSGKATLASDAKTSTVVCLDTNRNLQCDQDEPATSTDQEGYYSFEIEGTVDNGTLIIVKKGLAIIPFPDKDNVSELDARSLRYYKAYQAEHSEQNINVLSTLIANNLMDNGDGNYQEAIDDLSIQYPKYIDSTNDSYDDQIVNKEELLLDPIEVSAGTWYYFWLDSDNDLLHLNAALQSITFKNDKSIISASPARAAASEPSDQDALDTFYTTSADYFSELDAYIEQFIQWVTSLLDDEDATTDPDPEIHPPAPDPDPIEPQLVEIQRNHLNGIWYIIDASGDKTCSDIRSNNDIAVTEADGKTTNLTLTYDNNKKTMLLKLGFFTADTIKFSAYYDNETFKGNYESDGETLSGFKMDSLATCKSDKLGL